MNEYELYLVHSRLKRCEGRPRSPLSIVGKKTFVKTFVPLFYKYVHVVMLYLLVE